MGRLSRLSRLGASSAPPEVRELPAPGERVIAWGRAGGGEPVVVTATALYLPAGNGRADRLPFERIASASWVDPVLEIHTVGPARRRHAVRLAEPGRVPPAVRERVTASIVVTEHVTLGPGAGARITARRGPSGEDPATWNVVFDPGLDPSDPALRAAADAAIERLREATGL